MIRPALIVPVNWWRSPQRDTFGVRFSDGVICEFVFKEVVELADNTKAELPAVFSMMRTMNLAL